MGYSLLSQAGRTKQMALSGLRDASERDTRRTMMDRSLRQAKSAQTLQATRTGAGIGLLAGGPSGAVLGAVSGWILGELF